MLGAYVVDMGQAGYNSANWSITQGLIYDLKFSLSRYHFITSNNGVPGVGNFHRRYFQWNWGSRENVRYNIRRSCATESVTFRCDAIRVGTSNPREVEELCNEQTRNSGKRWTPIVDRKKITQDGIC